MDLTDILQSPAIPKVADWQLGNLLLKEVQPGTAVLIFCSDYRGTEEGIALKADYRAVREQLYQLSGLDFQVPIVDLGNLISGRTWADTQYVLAELIAFCYARRALPGIIGGSAALAYPLFQALNGGQQALSYTQIAGTISLENEGEELDDKNFLSRILSDKTLMLKHYHHLAYQKHLNPADSVQLLRQVDCDVVRLADMMGSTERVEPFFRHADIVTVDCNAVESTEGAFSTKPQVNGLNRREICAYMKEAGLSQQLKALGIYNYNAASENLLHHQLLAQMIWHFLEGHNIRVTHPAETAYETYWVMIGDTNYAFLRDSFRDLWYFENPATPAELVACAHSDYLQAQRGQLNPRLLRV